MPGLIFCPSPALVSLEGFVSVCVFAIHKQIVSHSDAQNKTKIRMANNLFEKKSMKTMQCTESTVSHNK